LVFFAIEEIEVKFDVCLFKERCLSRLVLSQLQSIHHDFHGPSVLRFQLFEFITAVFPDL